MKKGQLYTIITANPSESLHRQRQHSYKSFSCRQIISVHVITSSYTLQCMITLIREPAEVARVPHKQANPCIVATMATKLTMRAIFACSVFKAIVRTVQLSVILCNVYIYLVALYI